MYRYTTAPRSEYVKKAPKERTAGAAAAGNTSFSLFSAPEFQDALYDVDVPKLVAVGGLYKS